MGVHQIELQQQESEEWRKRMNSSIRYLFLTVFITLALNLPGFCMSQQGSKPLTVDSIVRSMNFHSQLPSAVKWLPKTDRFSYVKHDSLTGEETLWIENADDGQTSTLLNLQDTYWESTTETLQVSLQNYIWLPDESGLILLSNGDLWYYQLHNEELTRLTNSSEDETQVTAAPNSEYIGFVRDNNLYALRLKNQKEYQLTATGSQTILNGKLDWVYQEELVERGQFQAYWWSPDSKYLAYLQFDETNVPEYPLVDFIPYHPNLTSQHYPKAGDPNPVVKVGVVHLQNKPATVWMDTGENTEVYLPRVYWLPDGRELAFMRLDRPQEHLDFMIADTRNGNSEVILQEQDSHWINIVDDAVFLTSREAFIWGSERTGYRHLYLYNNSGELVLPLTSGDWMVTKLVSVDEENNLVYFIGTRKNISERHLYRIRFDGSGLERISEKLGNHEVKMSHSCNYYLDWYSNTTTPKQISLHLNGGVLKKRIAVPDTSILESYDLPTPKLFTFRRDSGITFHAAMIQPSGMDSSKKYPAIVFVYGGPFDQTIRNRYGGRQWNWLRMMAQRGYIIFCMDNRGSWGRGHAWEVPIDHKLGSIELRDQLQGVQYLKSLANVDSTQIGICGWSYGGYMTLYAMTHSTAFSTGVAIGPVVDWRDYDTIYTERYMGLPQVNFDGYYNSSPRHFADQLFGHLLLMHGTDDDNVHLQNTFQMADALINAEKQFNIMLYPQQRHGISSQNDQIFMYKMMTKFFDTWLKGSK